MTNCTKFPPGNLLLVAPGESGLTLRQFLTRRFSRRSARSLRRQIEGGGARINGKVQLFANVGLIEGDRVELAEISTSKLPIGHWPDRIFWEDRHFLAIDKPAGLSSEKVIEQAPLRTCRLIHRLDRETSGLLLLAKDRLGLESGEEHFRKNRVRKHYLALVEGQVRSASGSIDASLRPAARLPGKIVWKCAAKSDKSSPTDRSKSALTRWTCLSSNGKASLLYCRPKTGRTHQIRLHLSHLGHAVLGDSTYGATSAVRCARQMLHAHRLQIPQLDLDVAAPPPSDFAGALRSLALCIDLEQLTCLEGRDDPLSD